MKLVTFTESAHTRIGLLQGDHVIDLSKVAPTLPQDMLSLLRSGDAGMQEAAQYQLKRSNLWQCQFLRVS